MVPCKPSGTCYHRLHESRAVETFHSLELLAAISPAHSRCRRQQSTCSQDDFFYISCELHVFSEHKLHLKFHEYILSPTLTAHKPSYKALGIHPYLYILLNREPYKFTAYITSSAIICYIVGVFSGLRGEGGNSFTKCMVQFMR